MAAQKKIIFQKLFFIAGIIYSCAYLLACLTPYIDPVKFWPLTFLALGFVYLLAGMIVVFLLSLIFFRKTSLIFLLIIFAGFQNINSVFGFHSRKEFANEKNENSFRLLSWNVNYFGDCRKINDDPDNTRRKMFEFIQQSNPDVLCFQDFSNIIGKDFYSDINYIKDTLQYPYFYFAIDHTYNQSWAPTQYGSVMFSKFPFSDTGRIRFTGSLSAESFQFASIYFKGHPIKIINAHLHSMGIHAENASPREYNFLEADSGLIFRSSTFKKLKSFDKMHVEQAKLIKAELNKTDKPFIFCGDLNSVPSSFVYQHLCNGLSDAFLSTGFGFGGTYDSISPTLRIDVVLMDEKLKAIQHSTPHLHLSDHYPNLVDIQLK
ncbi:MAG TPA: endonuclease/exonuclease/phosphatase family protein [Chitinophagaceae bacterium]|nr:endonuclease/exonuclease/phosphatase family protein [Chitinophagaceae bacterium]